MLQNLLQESTIVYKLAGIGISTGLLNTILIKMGKKEIADTIDTVIGLSAFGYIIYIITTSIEGIQQVIALLG